MIYLKDFLESKILGEFREILNILWTLGLVIRSVAKMKFCYLQNLAFGHVLFFT